MDKEKIVFETNRLYFIEIESICDLYIKKLLKDALVMCYLGGIIADDDIEEFVYKLSKENSDKLCLCQYLMMSKEGDNFLGLISLSYEDIYSKKRKDTPVVSYMLDSKYWRQGFGLEAVSSFLDYCFKKYNIEEIRALNVAENMASSTLLLHAGLDVICLPDGTFSKNTRFCGKDIGVATIWGVTKKVFYERFNEKLIYKNNKG